MRSPPWEARSPPSAPAHPSATPVLGLINEEKAFLLWENRNVARPPQKHGTSKSLSSEGACVHPGGAGRGGPGGTGRLPYTPDPPTRPARPSGLRPALRLVLGPPSSSAQNGLRTKLWKWKCSKHGLHETGRGRQRARGGSVSPRPKPHAARTRRPTARLLCEPLKQPEQATPTEADGGLVAAGLEGTRRGPRDRPTVRRRWWRDSRID